MEFVSHSLCGFLITLILAHHLSIKYKALENEIQKFHVDFCIEAGNFLSTSETNKKKNEPIKLIDASQL